jgi:hypothetical protein
MRDETATAPAQTAKSDEVSARREFLKKIGAASATAPAVALLFAASQQPNTPRFISGAF